MNKAQQIMDQQRQNAQFWVPLSVLYFARCTYVYLYQWPDEEVALQHVKHLWPPMQGIDYGEIASSFSNSTSTEHQQMLVKMPRNEIIAVCNGLLFLCLPLAYNLFYLEVGGKSKEDELHLDHQEKEDRIPIESRMVSHSFYWTLLLRPIVTFIAVQSLFVFFVYMPRLLSRGYTTMDGMVTLMALLRGRNHNESESLPSATDTYLLFQNMFYISHISHTAWLTHVISQWAGFWIYFASNIRSLSKALFWSSLCTVIAFTTHGIEAPATYFIRNTYLTSWDHTSALHVFVHVATDFPVGIATLLGIA